MTPDLALVLGLYIIDPFASLIYVISFSAGLIDPLYRGYVAVFFSVVLASKYVMGRRHVDTAGQS